MYSYQTTHFPADAMPRGGTTADGSSDRAEQPVVLWAFAKLVLMVAALVILTPGWLDLLGELAYAPPPQAWGTLRLVALGGSAGFFTLAVLILKVWTGLLKHLARAD
jgi:hypothetical protein